MDIAFFIVLGALAGTVSVLIANRRRLRRGADVEPRTSNPVLLGALMVVAVGITILGIVLIQQR